MVDLRDIQDRLANMKLREAINQNPNIVVIVAVVLLAVSILFMVMRCGGPDLAVDEEQQQQRAWFYDTVTEEYFPVEGPAFPPITSPNGNPAVRAHFFTCSSCDPDDRFLGFYEKYTAETKAWLEEQAAEDDADWEGPRERYGGTGGMLYSFDAKQWRAPDDPGMTQEMSKRVQCPDGTYATHCRPVE